MSRAFAEGTVGADLESTFHGAAVSNQGKNEMDLNFKKRAYRLLSAGLVAATCGCVAPKTQVPTFWQKLGIPQAGARMRDGLVNRRGNFPGLEKKPPVLALADPANLDPSKPDMIKAAAEIKQDQDLKKQKIKAIKFLADVNCGCYNKDDKVEAAFLAALEDCDPDVRMAAVEGLDKAAGECTQCRNGCEVTCCTKKILEKLDDIANGMEKGCYKEPVEEIREAARQLACKCPPVCEDPIEPEELIAPPPEPLSKPKQLIEGDEVTYQLSDQRYGNYEVPPVVVDASHLSPDANIPASYNLSDSGKATVPSKSDRIANPEQLVKSQAVAYRKNLGELLVQMPDAFELDTGWVAIVVDEQGKHSLAKIIDVGGRRLLLAVDKPWDVEIAQGDRVHLGLVSK